MFGLCGGLLFATAVIGAPPRRLMYSPDSPCRVLLLIAVEDHAQTRCPGDCRVFPEQMKYREGGRNGWRQA